ncbi:MAG: amino acid adenylation domain-containing protein [Halanaerobiales bacterium]|nr:amino acid adenylation domain-containing protein [Halanaerobiales bacterium]
MSVKDKKIENQNVQDMLSLTPLQEGMLFHYLHHPENDYYFEQLFIKLQGNIKIELVKKAWDYVIEANEILRNVFRWKKLHKPVQIILKTFETPIIIFDLSNLTDLEKKQKVDQIKEKDLKEKIDISLEPFRITLILLSVNNCVMIISNHHILYDGWSTGIILKEFFQAYNALYEGIMLDKLKKNTFKEFVKWLQYQDKDEQKKYWTQYLEGFDTKTMLPGSTKCQTTQVVTGRYTFALDADLKNGINNFGRKNRITAAALLYTVWGILLQRYNNTDDVVFGTTVSGRNATVKGLEDMVGLFINTIPLRVRAKANSKEGILALLQDIDYVLKERTAYENVPLVDIKSCSANDPQESLFDSIVVIENYPLDKQLNQKNNVLVIESYSMFESTNFDLTLAVEMNDHITIQLIYNTLKFDEQLIQRLPEHFSNILTYVIEKPNKKLSQIDILSREEKDKILFEFNNTYADYPKDKTIHELFQEQVENIPNNIAVVYEGQKLIYRELNEKANRLARTLRENGVNADSIVGILVDRSLEMLVGIFGILKAGGAYLPINPNYPEERVKYMLEDSGADILLTHEYLKNKAPFKGQIFALEDEKIYTNVGINLDQLKNPHGLAYIIYTSGSTGKPKGVMVSHKALNNYLYSIYSSYRGNVGIGDRCLSMANISFDASVVEIFMPLTFGATLILFNNEIIPDIHKLAKIIMEKNITFVLVLPTLLKELYKFLSKEKVKLNKMLVGIEPIKDDLLENYIVLNNDMQILNGYGPTETTICSTFFKYEKIVSIGGNLPIGKPLANTQIYILDQYSNLLPVGVFGELCISGDGLAEGYLNRQTLTEEKFVPNPFIPEKKMYKTGDLARWLTDGNLEFLGRLDHQVKIRGYRIEPGEIQNQLLKYEKIKDAIVIDQEDKNGAKYLCAYVVLNREVITGELTPRELTPKELRTFLLESLPQYMIPSYFVQLEKMPLNTNGKIDRKALPKPEGNIVVTTEYEPPQNEIEEKLVEIWKEVLGEGLGIAKIGINDNFFELGGHSLKATTLVAKIHKEMNIEVPLNEIFKTLTIKGISKFIQSTTKTAYESIEKVVEKSYYDASSAQKRMYMLQQLDLQSTGYNMTGIFEVEGNLNLNQIEKVFIKLIQRHETLRTSFDIIEEKIVQRVNSQESVEDEFQVEFLDINLEENSELILVDERENVVGELVREFVRPFDLNKAPLFKIKIIKLTKYKHILMFDMHHIISDGTSMDNFMYDFGKIYENRELDGLRIQYKDFAEWQNKRLKSDMIKKQEKYWTNRFSDELPVLNLPTDYYLTSYSTQSLKGDTISFTLGQKLTKDLNRVTRVTGSTLYMMLLSAVNILLSKYSGQEDIVIGSPIAGRPHVDLEKIIGMFVNTLAMRNKPEGNKIYEDFLKEVKANALEAYENQEYQFEELVEKLNLRGDLILNDLHRNPLFDVMFVLQNTQMQNTESGEFSVKGLKFSPYNYESKRSKFDLTVLAIEVVDDIKVDFEYSTKLFKRETIERMISHFRNILKVLVANPKVQLCEIDLLTEAEKEQILYEFNDTYVDYPRGKTIHELFEEQVRNQPDQIAVVFAEKKFIYRELNERANHLAGMLREKGVKDDTIVGILAERLLDMVVGVLAILKAGGAYLPIDPEYPEERMKLMLEDCSVGLVLTPGNLIKNVDYPCTIINILDETSSITSREKWDVNTESIQNIKNINKPESLAYVIYTSGSTGKPKGVMVEHRSVVRLIKNQSYIKFEQGDKILQTGTLAFDASTFEIWGALLNGLELHLGVKDLILSAEAMENYIVSKKISILWLTAPLFHLVVEDRPQMFKELKYLLAGGDVLSPKHVNKVRNECWGLKVVNGYGPTENTTFSTCFIVDKEYSTTIPIGKPISNSTAYIVDKYSQLCPIGVYGELWVGGDGLSRGYLNKPELTAEKFIQNPFKINLLQQNLFVSGEKMYRTGDLVRWLPDGNIEFLGRIDHQVKIRGFRIELGEIENRLLQHDEIKEAIVIDQEDENGNKYLCAYFVAYKIITVSEIRKYLTQNLPDYMIPSYFLQLDRMPLNRNKKIDRNALPKLESTILISEEYEAPRNELEERLVSIWAEVLGMKEIGINNNFFELGGHSLKATILVSKIHKSLNVVIPLREVFKRPTIKELAAYVNQSEQNIYSSIHPVEETEYYSERCYPLGYYELSSAQKRMYLLQQFDVKSTGYNIPVIFTIEGDLDIARLEKIFKVLTEKHQVLRTSFVTQDNNILQRIHNEIDFNVEYIEKTDQLSKKIINNEVKEFIRPFDLCEAPLFRVRVTKFREVRYLLMFDIHHIISDGVSMGILVNEFISLYEGKKTSKLRIQYKDYAIWQNKLLQSGVLKNQEEYWLNQFSDEISVLNLPTDYFSTNVGDVTAVSRRPKVQSFEGDTIFFTFNRELTNGLKRIIKKTNRTMYMVLLSGVNILLAKYSGQNDIVVGSPIAGRPHADLENIIGMFVNTLAMRNKPEGSKTYEKFLSEVSENALKAYENQDYQFEELVNRLNIQRTLIPRDLSRNPLFDVMFSMQNFNNEELRIENLELKSYNYNHRISKFDISIAAIEKDEEITLNLSYNIKLFKRETVERMILHLRNIYREVTANTNIRLNEIIMLTEEEKHQTLYEFNNTDADFPKNSIIHQIFEEQVEKIPNYIAVVYKEQKLTYRELNEKINRLARNLREKGVKSDSIVGILVDRSLMMMIGILGILKSGGAYLPISPEYPEDRIKYMLSDSKSDLVLTQSKHVDKVTFNAEIIDIEDEKVYAANGENLESINKPESLAYVIYTSGSTGKPKGVVIEHRSVINTITHLQKQYPLNHTDTILQCTVYTFDASVREIFWWFFNGSRCCLLVQNGEKNPREIVETIARENVTMAKFVPVLLNEVFNVTAELGKEKIRSLKYLLVGGEALSRQLVKKYFDLFGSDHAVLRPRFVNVYGPSEATIHCTEYEIKSPIESVYAPIGKPISNDRIYILDQAQNPVAIGIPGELYISGVGLAREYLNNTHFTAERFIVDPWNLKERMYRSGDLAKWLPDGNIEFLGRIDHQVKIRGYRIEIGEIESKLVNYEVIEEAVVIDRQDENRIRYLCAYVVASKELTVKELRQHLSKNLPDYMIPSYFIQLDKMPLNKNGKVDRKALPEPEVTILTGVEYEAPGNEIEEKLASIWVEVLGVEKIGIHDNFFELGGHSLKAIILASKIHKELNVELPLREVFQRPTIKNLAEFIAGAEENLFLSIQPIEVARYYSMGDDLPEDYPQDYYPASSAQKRLYVQGQFKGVGVSYNMPGVIMIEGDLNREKFEQVFKQLVERHETLRTSFEMLNGEVVQKIQKEIDFTISFIEVCEGSVQEMLSEFVRPFDLSIAPLLRVRLAKSKDRYIMFFDMHHIISDGVSIDNLVKEFIALYQGINLPKLKVQYKDFAVWQNELLKTDIIESQEKYWLGIFADEIPILNMSTDYPRPSIQSFRGENIEAEIDGELIVKLRELAIQTGSTLYMVLLTAYNVLLSKYTGQEDIVIGSPIAGRRHADLENIIGMFVNMLALRNVPCSSKTFREFLTEVKDNTLLAFDNQDYQFEELVRAHAKKLNLHRDLSRNPLFNVVFSFQDAIRRSVIEIDGLRFIPHTLENNISKFDITLEVIDETNRMWLSIEYCTDLFKKETMERLSSHFINILREITKNPEVSLAEINMLSGIERRQLLSEFNTTKMEYAKDKTIHELFAEQVEKTPNAIALVFAEEKLTYKELNTRANQLAYRLRGFGVKRDEIIAIMAERSIDMVIAILGVLKSGGAYMPIDLDYPVERIIYMLEDSKTRILLTHEDFADRIEFKGEVIDLSNRTNYKGDGYNLININKPDDLVYVMYTSGSTGKPKGVMIEHQGVVSLSKYYYEMFKLCLGKNILHMSNVSFDTAVVEIFPPLIYGATVFIIRKELALDTQGFIEFVQENQINFAQFVPITLQEILGQSEKLESLDTVIVGGDKLDDTVKDHILSLGYQLTNHYGPTEGTVDAIVAKCVRRKSTIGKPIANTRVYILDKNNDLTPVGVPGELCISGVGLTRGYLNLPELTAEKFVPNPWLLGERIYRTGDLACWQSDGNITFLGRIDNQVKIRGYRIELGEIEQQLLKHESVDGVFVVDRVDSSGNKYLCAYIVAERELTISELRTHLVQELPDYMIPSHFMQIERIPFTHNGKIDRRALPKPEGGIDTEVEYVAPTNEIEEKLITIWQKLLMIEEIGINYNFFEMGGHSLKAVQVVNLVHKEFNIQISLQDIFTAPTIKELSKLIQSKEISTFSAIEKMPEQKHYELSYNQKRLWIVSQLEPANRAYNMAGRITFNEEVDEAIITRVFDQLVNRHESLRTQFKVVEGSPVQVINFRDCFKLQIFDLLNLNEKERSSECESIYEKLTEEPFNIVENSLLRAGLVKFSQNQFDIVFCMHHIISDGWSIEILKEEFYLLYHAYKEGKECELAPLTVQYKDYAVWQNRLIADQNKNQQAREYWMNKLSRGFPVLNLPEDYPSGLLENRKSAGYRIFIPEKIKDQLKAAVSNYNTSLFIVTITMLKMFLADLTGQEEIAIGVPSMGRQHQNLSNVIGFFINTIVLINSVRSQTSFEEMLDMIHKDTLKALEYQDYPLELITDELKIKYPKIQVFFNLLNIGQSHLETVEDTGSHHIEKVQDVKFDIMFYLTEYANGIEVVCTYLIGLYKPSTIEYIVGEYIRFIRKILGCEEHTSDDDDDLIIRG